MENRGYMKTNNKCIDCKHHMYSDMYLECSKAIPGTYPNYNDGCDEWEAEKCCCNCVHCARWRKSTGVETHCDLDDRYLGYVEAMDTDRNCPNWEMEKELPTETSMQKLYNEWNPIKYRKCTEEEKQGYSEFYGWDIDDIKYTYDCKLPDDNEEVLITTKAGYVALTTYFNDSNYGCYFENYEDFDDVLAWMSLPESYKKGGKE